MGDGWQLCATELCHVYADAHNRAGFLSLTLTFQARSLVPGGGGAVLGTVGHLAASLASSHEMPIPSLSPAPAVTIKMSLDIANVPAAGQGVQNHLG